MDSSGDSLCLSGFHAHRAALYLDDYRYLSMSKKERLALEYGYMASAAGGQFKPLDGFGMKKLIIKARSESGHKRNSKILRAWYFGYTWHKAQSEEGITPEIFTLALTAITNCVPESITVWLKFAVDCVELKQIPNIDSDTDHARAVNWWLGSILAGFMEVEGVFGANIAKQVCELSLIQNCIYPYEMLQAAEHLQQGGNTCEIMDLSEKGLLNGEMPFLPIQNSAADASEYCALPWSSQ